MLRRGFFFLSFPKTKPNISATAASSRDTTSDEPSDHVRCAVLHTKSRARTRMAELNVFACLDLSPSLLAASHHRGIYVCSFPFGIAGNVLCARLYAVARLHFGVIFNAVIYADAIIDYGHWPSQYMLAKRHLQLNIEETSCAVVGVCFFFRLSFPPTLHTSNRSHDRCARK